MNVPARVAADAKSADEALQSLAAAAAAANNPPAPADTQPPAPAPTDTQPPPPPPAPQPVAQPTSVELELQRARQQLQTLTGRMEATQRQLEQLQRQPAQPPTPTPTPPPAPLVTAEDHKEFGDDLIDLIERVLRQNYGTRIDDLGSRLSSLEGRLARQGEQVKQVGETAAEMAHRRYLESLDSAMPGWESTNNDPGFVQWLEKIEPASGRPYGELLQQAHTRREADRVINIFGLYKPELLANRAPANPPPAPAPSQPSQPTGRVDPAQLAAPKTDAPPPPPANPPAGPQWTTAMVDKLYEDRQRGRITPTEFAQREKEYLRALAEGRVAVV